MDWRRGQEGARKFAIRGRRETWAVGARRREKETDDLV